MASTTIEWADRVWNPVTGCTKVSQGCVHCYAERMAHRLQAMGQPHYANGFAVTLHEDALDSPLKWKKPRRVFVNSMSDLFHSDVPFEFIDRVWWTMAGASQHTFMVLTKRPDRMLAYIRSRTEGRVVRIGPYGVVEHLSNVWLGTSIESADYLWRADYLCQTPAAVRFVSLEPLLGPIDLSPWLPVETIGGVEMETWLDWVITGGESGAGARPMHPDWARDIRDQCVAAGVPFFFKQWGEFSYHPLFASRAPDANGCRAFMDHEAQYRFEEEGQALGYQVAFDNQWMIKRVGKKRVGRLLDGREWNEMPE